MLPTSLRWRNIAPYLELVLALVAAGLWYSTGGAVWYRENAIGLWPLLLVLAIWPLHWISQGPGRIRSFDLWFALFLASGLVSLWAAYDRQIALAKYGLLIGAVGLAVALAHQPSRQHLYASLVLLCGMATALGLFFILTNDWNAQPAKVPFLLALGRMIAAPFPTLPGHRITPNVAGGILGVLLPFSIALLYLRPHAWLGVERGTEKAIKILIIVATSLQSLALLLTVSRGAWLGVAVAGGLWLLWRWVVPEPARDLGRWRRQLLAMALFVAAIAFLGLTSVYTFTAFRLPFTTPILGRLSLWRNAWLLAQDYPYTGVGMGLFQLPFSIYSLLIHVGYVVYSHNTFLDILIEQGILGLFSFIWLMVAAVISFGRWRRLATPGLGFVMEACLASIAVMIGHGFVDSVLYGSRGALLLFVPHGVMMAATSRAAREAAYRKEYVRRPAIAPGLTLTLIFFVVSILIIARGHPVAAWYANLGAVAQTRAELQAYDPNHFNERDIDQVRREVDLSKAQGYLERAAAQPEHPAALRRLAALALARGAYEEALSWMEIAWKFGHRDSATRLLYGDALVANGYIQEAAQVVAGLEWGIPRLEGQAWSRYWVRKEYMQAAYAWETVAILAPEREDVRQRAAEARRRAGVSPSEAP